MLRLPSRVHKASAAPLRRFYSEKPSIRLVAELRKRTEVSISKARDALSATNNDVPAALEWLQNDLVTSGAKKAAKVDGRAANEGLVSVSVLSRGVGSGWALGSGGVRAAMIELNCETDFVGRNALFGALAADIAHTAAFLAEPLDPAALPAFAALQVDALLDAPLLSHADPAAAPTSTIGSAIRDAIAKLGEKIALRRGPALAQEPQGREDRGMRLGAYLHGSVGHAANGRMGALVALLVNSPYLAQLAPDEKFIQDLEQLERALARQVVGFDTRQVMSLDFAEGRARDPLILYDQPFAMFPGNPDGEVVEHVLQRWAVARGMLTTEEDPEVITESSALVVTGFEKWTVGESLAP
ncbi:hypothetical protein FIBSPDRAFT_387085 [Athelia psychrophila]|uniref:Elongation factor Ts, mitochondrial n=1 Tax=Athelia psychrophila TaxID=1759441 RepID=A0A166NQZ4_9AGAM|nr:hypothetical protein FIBSPDRAFT_387085 [Fibularhizoctonia sp. CBS 109695]